MSIDRSLRGANMLVRHRNVLNRVERLGTLRDEEKWTEAKSVYGLPKVGHRKQEMVKAEKAVAVEGATPAAGAAAPAAKAAAPAAKAAAPAAKAPAKK